jgi:hypothetical protein
VCKALFPIAHLHEYGDEKACGGCHNEKQSSLPMLSPEEKERKRAAGKEMAATFKQFFKS